MVHQGQGQMKIEAQVHDKLDSKSVYLDLQNEAQNKAVAFNSKQSVYLFGMNLSLLPKSAQFLFCSILVMGFYVIYGFLLELIFRLEGFQQFGWYLTLIQFFLYTCFGWSERKILREPARSIPLRTYAQLALYTVVTMGFSNSAVGYLNYPTQVIFKCCKLIPVLIGGILIQGKKYGFLDFVSAFLMSIGLALFTLADSQISPNFHAQGYVMICLALIADAIIGNVQEKTMKQYGASNNEVILYSYSIGFLYILAWIVLSGQLVEAFRFCLNHPKETYGYAFIFSVCGYFGISAVLTLVRAFGAFVAVTVTTFRKALTIIVSFVIFSKPFTFQYVWSGLLVLLGIYLNLYSKHRQSWDEYVSSFLRNLVLRIQRFGLERRRIVPMKPEHLV